MLHSRNITIAHKHDLVALNLDDAMYNIATTFDPRQHHMADL